MSDSLRFCQFCGAPLEADMKVCAGCGQPVGGSGSPMEYAQGSSEASAPSGTPPPTPAEPGPTGFPSQKGANFPPPPPPAGSFSQPSAGSRKGKFPIWSIVVLVLVVLCGCCLLFVIGGFALFRNAATSENQDIPSIVETFIPFNATDESFFAATQPFDRSDTAPAPLVTPTPGATQTASPSSPTQPVIRQNLSKDTLTDDFSSNLFGWAEESDDISVHGFRDGRYFIRVLQPEYMAWSFIPTDFNPTFLRFTAQIQGDSSEGTFGVMCNFQDSDNYDFVEINPEARTFLIGRYMSNEEFSISPSYTNWIDSLYLKEDPYAVNQIAVHCTTDTIQLEINGGLEGVKRFDFPAKEGGSVALFAFSLGNLSPSGFTVYFDDLLATTRE